MEGDPQLPEMRYCIYEWNSLEAIGTAPVFSTDDIILWHRVASRIETKASRTIIRVDMVIFSYFRISNNRMGRADALAEYKKFHYCRRPVYWQEGLASVKKVLFEQKASYQ